MIWHWLSGRVGGSVSEQLHAKTQTVHGDRADGRPKGTVDRQRPLAKRKSSARSWPGRADRQAQRHEFPDRVQQLFEQGRCLVPCVVQRSLFP